MRGFLLLAITLTLLTGCDEKLPTKADDSYQGIALKQQIDQLQQYNPSQLPNLLPIQQQCNTPKKQCTPIKWVKPDGSMQNCVMLVVPECDMEFKQVLQRTADTALGCNGNTSTFCKSFLNELNPALELPASLQSTYGWTLDTPYFHGNQWDYRTEVYPMGFHIIAALLGTLVFLFLLYPCVRYYDKRRLAKQQAKAAAESAVYWEAKRQQEALEQKQRAEAAEKALEAAKRNDALRKEAEQKKREEGALKAEIAQRAEAEALAKQQEHDRWLDDLIKD
jgi:hypothetical protein